MRGKKPIPPHIQALRGNPSRRPLKETPTLELGIPEPPTFLSPTALKYWKEVSLELHGSSLLAKADRGVLAAYCSALATLHKADTWLKRHNWIVDGGNGPKKHPYVMIAKESREQVKALAAELGISITSRSRLRVDDREEIKEDPFESYQKQKPKPDSERTDFDA